MKKTANEIYDLLLNDFKIKEKTGTVEITLGGISAQYGCRDALGDLIQEWLGQFLSKNNIYFQNVTNTQDFPDFLLTEDTDKGFLEIKTFNAAASPAFDIANFNSYCLSLLSKVERLDADYLIFGYEMESGILKIKDVWLKKVWEISGESGTNPINLQTKYEQPYNIRPIRWYSDKSKNKSFTTRLAFVEALNNTRIKYKKNITPYSETWLDDVRTAYKNKTGIDL